MTTENLTITAFIEARIAEDEAVASRVPVERADTHIVWDHDERGYMLETTPARILATCKAHRAIVEMGPSECGGYADQDSGSWKHYPDPEWGHCDGCSAAESFDASWRHSLRALASIWADHQSFKAEWAL